MFMFVFLNQTVLSEVNQTIPTVYAYLCNYIKNPKCECVLSHHTHCCDNPINFGHYCISADGNSTSTLGEIP